MDSQVKASHMKVLLRWLALITSQIMLNPQSFGETLPGDYLELRASCMYHLVFMLCLFDANGLVLTANVVEQISVAGDLFLLSYQALAAHNLERQVALYRVRPKTHYLCHLIEFVQRYKLNPRFVNCFMDEDFMGRVKRIIKGCYKPKVCATGPLRYLELRALRLARQ
jgi:hypothetical protein